jgi:hypothetical protein
MTNVKTSIKGSTLTIEVNLTERHGPSSSGKTEMIASSQGNVKLPPPHADISFGLNVYTKIKA